VCPAEDKDRLYVDHLGVFLAAAGLRSSEAELCCTRSVCPGGINVGGGGEGTAAGSAAQP
jgi:hypothetical protein